MTRYSLELLNIDEPVKQMLLKGGLSVRRSSNYFSRVGVDMALEQTINAEAKNRLKGVIAFADVNTAVNRWLVTSSMRTEIVNRVLDIAGMGRDDESKNKETNPKRMKRDANDLIGISRSILDMVNPFDANINKDVLFNIKTGRKASPAAEQYLLSVISEGECKRDTFIKECDEDQSRFEKPITRSKIVNFATESFVKKNKSKKADEIVQLKGTRDLFARLLFLAVKKKLCTEDVLKFPLTPIPSELAHPDGSIRTTAKNAVIDLFDIEKQGPNYVETVIVDGMFLLRTLCQPLPHNLRGLVRHILMKALKMSHSRVDLVFDTYNSPCIKDITRELRADDYDDDADVYTFGAGQITPKAFLTLLKSSNFKKEFLRFFHAEIRNQEYANVIGKKTLYCSVDNECISLQCDEEGELTMETVHDLYGAHDEADTRVAFHALHVERCHPGNTVIRCNDTDVLIIMLANHEKFKESHVWLDVGLDYNNSRHYVDIKATAQNINYIRALPGIYAFTGCDYIPAFLKKEKKDIEVMLKNNAFIDVFSRLGEEKLTDNDVVLLEEFTCAMFGYTKLSSINEARYSYFKSKCTPKASSKPLDSLKSVDPSLFPPCSSVLLEQMRRTWYIAKLYKNATASDPVEGYTPLDYGFELVHGSIQVRWYCGEQVPREVEEDDDVDEDENDDEEEVTDEECDEDEDIESEEEEEQEDL